MPRAGGAFRGQVSQDSARAADRIHDSCRRPEPQAFVPLKTLIVSWPHSVRRSLPAESVASVPRFDIKESGDDATLRQVLFLTLGALALLALAAWAQQGRGGGMGGGPFS